MPHSACSEDIIALSSSDKQLLLDIARAALLAATSGVDPYPKAESESSELKNYPPALRQEAACFVTLSIEGQLRGCIGSLQAHQALVYEVRQNTASSALRDPRFAPVSAADVDRITIEISILSQPKAMQFSSESDLLKQIIPFEDGLVLEEGRHRATFLPLVWEKLPNKADFLTELKSKAGLPRDYWSNRLSVSRYKTLIIEE
jgi:AmmeMemoRadiSam system protein A